MLPKAALRRTLVALAVSVYGLAAAPAVLAQTLTITTPGNLSTTSGDYQISVKYLCGTIASATPRNTTTEVPAGISTVRVSLTITSPEAPA